jgi:Fur family ferric uptake transcriptional regulator
MLRVSINKAVSMTGNRLLETAIQRLKLSGYKLTNARRTVLEILCSDYAHLTSAEVLTRASGGSTPIGRASVFRTLDLLTELAIIRPTYLRPGTPHYIVMPEDGHHAHIICPKCQRVIEIDDCEIEGLLDEIITRHHIKINGHLLELYGECEHCQ